jgi:hypothetical protein
VALIVVLVGLGFAPIVPGLGSVTLGTGSGALEC